MSVAVAHDLDVGFVCIAGALSLSLEEVDGYE